MDERSGPANSFGDPVKLFARKPLLFLGNDWQVRGHDNRYFQGISAGVG
ncbi:MAG: hypothetical protein WCB11_04735 [Terriglobales bacterium]